MDGIIEGADGVGSSCYGSSGRAEGGEPGIARRAEVHGVEAEGPHVGGRHEGRRAPLVALHPLLPPPPRLLHHPRGRPGRRLLGAGRYPLHHEDDEDDELNNKMTDRVGGEPTGMDADERVHAGLQEDELPTAEGVDARSPMGHLRVPFIVLIMKKKKKG